MALSACVELRCPSVAGDDCLTRSRKFDTADELELGIDHYIRYYNQDRIKLKLQGLSPVEYRMSFAPQ
jgi:transposase InsO family protein